MTNLAPILIVAALLFWTWASLRLERAAQPLRLELARKGERLLGDTELPDVHRDLVKGLLDSAFSSRGMLFAFMILVPVFAVTLLFMSRQNLVREFSQFRIKNSETRTAFDDVMRLHDRIMFANHPILYIIVEIEFTLFVKIAWLITAVARELLAPIEIGRDTAMDLIEVKRLQWANKLPRRFHSYAT